MLKTPQPSATTSNTKTHLKKTTATQKSKPGITRVTLSNGYRAYHHRTDGDNMRPAKQQQKQQKKKVRFVKGDVTSAGLTDDGSESGRDDDDDEYDFLGDESLEEADGWIPVMVAEQDEGYDWISLTGSFVMMGGVSEAHK
ncbi:hypothetical protein N658DRAFT_475225 [Parathielavia hyrcaniae]|uniref:Uncharacterized protein n=1 Tax=Parathielavia hyrcaniae TaxID=113614 RepID=A0AAN6T0F1_9PEZI|nr:hypothetical protein N658DRAFT_475225 [Parathielavia hyrcaniae]